MPDQPAESAYWPGKQFSLPETGPRSMARLGRRALAILIDWAIATGLALLVTHQQDAILTLVIFAVLQYVFLVTLSGSIGQLLLGMRVVPLDPKWIGPIKPLVRTVLLCLVVPAVIWDRDQRGLHDKIAFTVLVRK